MLSTLKYAWRNFKKDRQFSLLNLIGLSCGLACSILIFLWVQDERSIDKFHEKDSRLYQVLKTSLESDGTIDTHETTPGIMAASLKADYPEIEYAVPVVIEENKGLIGVNNKMIKAETGYAGKDFFKIFTYAFLDGNKKSALNDEKGVVISDKTALALFNTTNNLIGKTIEWRSEEEISGLYKITGVFKSPPANSSGQFDVIFSFQHYYNTFLFKYGMNRWNSNNPSTFIVLREGVDINTFNEKIKDYSRRKMLAAEGPGNLKWEGAMFLQKYSDRYLFNQYDNGKIAGGRIAYVRLFSVIAFLILIIACINFMNLATAKTTARIREAGIRKLVGARRGSLIIRYITESTFIALLSLTLAITIVIALLPQFRLITQKELHLSFNAQTVITLLSITLVTGILAGSYPALYLTSFKPAWVLKGSMHFSGGQTAFRKGLVVFQFTLSVIFIIAVIVVYRQMKFVQEKNLGFEKNNIISFTTEGKVRDEMPAFLAEVRKLPGVMHASGMDGDFTGNHSGGGGIDWEGKTKGMEFDGFYVYTDWLETFSVPLVEGHTFRKDVDSNAVLFNETAIRMMGLKNPVGKRIVMWGKECYIAGVVKDFHYESLYSKPGPFFIRYQTITSNIVARLDPSSVPATMDRIKTVYNQFNNGVAFDYKFLDDDFDKLYASEKRVSVLSKYFATLAILISCLGLFGLAAFTAQKRQKEIGVRKVLGASAHTIALMLSGNFLKLVTIALIIAFPLSWWLMNQWLMDFQYRINIGADIFLYASAATLLITVCTVSFQAIRASLANPVKSLRTE